MFVRLILKASAVPKGELDLKKAPHRESIAAIKAPAPLA